MGGFLGKIGRFGTNLAADSAASQRQTGRLRYTYEFERG
jgi:hypothetical protein